jgi:hypothetical protein
MARSLIPTAVAGLLWLAALVATPTIAFGQATSTPTATPTHTPAPSTATATQTQTQTATATPTPGPGLSLSPSQGAPGTSVTSTASGFQPGETVDLDFNGTALGDTGTADTEGKINLSFTVPNLAPGQYSVTAHGQTSNFSASSTFTINQSGAGLSLSATEAAPSTSVTATANGFQPGETVQLNFNGASVGTATTNTNGSATITFNVPNLGPGQYTIEARGQTSNLSTSATFTVSSPTTPTTTPVPGTATPTPSAPTPTAQPAPPIPHDEGRYFSQTGYRIDNDQVFSFFQTYGGVQTFGYPVSRTVTFLGCPVQFFQRQIIQVCASQGPALINMLDPDIFPYTKVNGSTFPGPDTTVKNNTPPVSDPNYSTAILAFVQATVPDSYAGQPVNFHQYFNSQGGLVIWGAPISNPQPDPNNANFIYQRFLLADYRKALLLDQNVPPDLLAEAQGSRFLKQYCPGAPLWLCRPNDLSGTDLTFAFVNG